MKTDLQKNGWRKKAVLFLVSQCITLFGSTLVQMAVVWYVTLETGSGVWVSAVSAVIPQLVPEAELLRFNGANAAMQAVVQFAAPAAAGALLTLADLHSVLWVDVVTALAGIGLFACVRLPETEKEEGGRNENRRRFGGQAHNSVLSDLKTGISYVFSRRRISRLLMLYGLFVLLCVPAGFLAGLLVSRVYGDSYGSLTAVELAGFAGMTAGGLLMSVWGGFQRRERMLATGLAVFGLMSALMGMTENFIWYLVLMAVYGIALTAVQTTITTLLQEETESSMQGRVFGLQSSMYAGFLPLGMGLFGPLADVIPLQWIMIGAGVLLVFTGAVCAVGGDRYQWKNMLQCATIREREETFFSGWKYARGTNYGMEWRTR